MRPASPASGPSHTSMCRPSRSTSRWRRLPVSCADSPPHFVFPRWRTFQSSCYNADIITGKPMDVVSFAQISRILELTDSLGLNREWVEIPLSPERPGQVRRLPNGKLEIIVDADRPFEEWLGSLPMQIQSAQGT